MSAGGRAVAFAAPSGGGKTALAAMAWLNGAELVADDTLALVLDDVEVRCLPGDRELRLRPAPAETLSGASWTRRATADGRVAMVAGSKELAPPSLAAIVVPGPCSETTLDDALPVDDDDIAVVSRPARPGAAQYLGTIRVGRCCETSFPPAPPAKS